VSIAKPPEHLVRRGAQIARMLLLIDHIRDRQPMTLTELQAIVKPKVSGRTIRRDLMILLDLRYVVPFEDHEGHTRWRWVRDDL
jgi:predicted DNA-binding transcriptional regulator YafY